MSIKELLYNSISKNKRYALEYFDIAMNRNKKQKALRFGRRNLTI